MPREPSSTMRFRKIVSPTEAKTLLVVVPGIGTRLPEEWIDDRGNLWLENIPNGIAPDLVVYVYMHELSLSDASPWQKLVDAGRDFLIDLVELLKDTEKVLPSLCPTKVK
ncbi:hypothetical protein MMC14_008348 [Varicellaria rhodocarpa]|nr:hypothetical protein [Varicellaria rhodocarpa]